MNRDSIIQEHLEAIEDNISYLYRDGEDEPEIQNGIDAGKAAITCAEITINSKIDLMDWIINQWDCADTEGITMLKDKRTADNKWTVKKGSLSVFKGNFKECRKYCKLTN